METVTPDQSGKGDIVSSEEKTVFILGAKLHDVGRAWHAAKVLFEKDWLRRWF